MKTLIPHVLVALSVLVSGCGVDGPEPITAVPSDADAIFAIRPVTYVEPRLSRVLERLPEGNGIVELVTSLTGVDLGSESETRKSGLDPARGIAVAAWEDAILVILPVADEDLGSRKLGLRLARLGFLEDPPPGGGLRTFRSTRGENEQAALQVGGGLARICIGDVKPCVENRPEGVEHWSPDRVAIELAMDDAIAVGVIRNRLLAGLLDRMGLSLKGAARAMTLALLGDFRFALGVDPGIRFRAAAGPEGNPVEMEPHPPGPPDGIAALLSLAIPPALTGKALGDGLARLMKRPLEESIRTVVSTWTGEAIAAVMVDESAKPAPLVLDLAILDRLDWNAVLGFRDGETAGRAAAGLATSGFSGLLIDAVGDKVLAGSRKAGPRGLSLGGPRHRVLHFVMDPGALLHCLGGGGVEFLKHMVGALSTVFVDLWFEPGRPVLDAGVVIR